MMNIKKHIGVASCIFTLGTSLAWGIEIGNDKPVTELGHWRVDVVEGGESHDGYLTAVGTPSGTIFQESEVIFDYHSFVDIGGAGGAFRLSDVTLIGPTLISSGPGSDDIVTSSGSFIGEAGNIIDWSVESKIADDDSQLVNTFIFTAQTGNLGTIRLYQYLDEDVNSVDDDVFFTRGSFSNLDLELFTVDDAEAFGVSHSGAMSEAQGLVNSSFSGYAGCEYNEMQPAILNGTQSISLTGDLCAFLSGVPVLHPVVGNAYGPIDVVSTLAWDVNPDAQSATIMTTLGGVPEAPEPEEPISITKDYRHTNVCFEKDNDNDGLFSEDPVNFDSTGLAIDDDQDGLFNEDATECLEGTSLSTELPVLDNTFLLKAVTHPKSGRISTYNPGQYYAVSTIDVAEDIEALWIEENFSACIDNNISELNPKTGGGSVVIVIVGTDGVAKQIMNAHSEDVTIEDNIAKAHLSDIPAGTSVLMYVKFKPRLDSVDDLPASCNNITSAKISEEGDAVEANAELLVVEK